MLASGRSGGLSGRKVVNQTFTNLTSMQSLLQRIERQVRLHRSTHTPAHNAAGEHVDDEGDIHEAGPCGEWSERPAVVELFVGLSSPNRTCTFQRIRLSI